jgi:hypothetical protein
MNDRDRPLPLQDVFDIVERRRRRRSKVRAVVGPTAAVGAAGLTGLIVLVLQIGPERSEPAAQPGGPPAALASSLAPSPPQAALPPKPEPFDPADLDRDFLAEVADGVTSFPEDADRALIGEQATAIEQAWGLEFYPQAKAVAVKALRTGTPLVVDDPSGAEALVNGFERAGYTEQDAAELAAAWGTDERTAKIVGILVAEAR